MTPGIALPDPIPLPAPAWLLWGLLMLTFVLHVLAMNSVLGGAVIGVASRLQARNGDRPYHASLAGLIARAMPAAIAATVTLGVAALLFLQVLYGRVFFPSSVVMAWIWFAVVPLLIVAYYAAYATALRRESRALVLPIMIAVIFLVIAAIYTTNMSLMLRPSAILDAYRLEPRGIAFIFGDASVYPRYLHIVTGAVATSAVFVSLAGLLVRRRDEAYGRWMIRYGALWFVVLSVLNMVMGLWWLAMLPQPTLMALLGQNTAATIVLVVGIATGLCAIVCVISAIQSPRPWLPLAAGAIGLLATIVLMIFTRDYLRRAALEVAGFEPSTWTVSQWGPIAIFGVLLVVAVAVVVWMTAALVKAPKGTVPLGGQSP
jgi:hypothetical protein